MPTTVAEPQVSLISDMLGESVILFCEVFESLVL